MDNIKMMRINKGLTQEQASKILNVTKEYLSMIERGVRNPSDKLKIKMAKLYNCNISDIFLALRRTKRLKS